MVLIFFEIILKHEIRVDANFYKCLKPITELNRALINKAGADFKSAPAFLISSFYYQLLA